MPVIKRYPNRKLYDTEAKEYITLEGIARQIRQGQPIQVTDNATGEDLTALTLTQIIFEQEKKQAGFLPHALLEGLIQAGGSRLGAMQRTLLSSPGISHLVDEEIRQRIKNLIEQGILSEEEGQDLVEKLVSQSVAPRDKAQPLSQDFMQILKDRLPTHEDFQRLEDQLENLSHRLERIQRERNESSPD
jgi:polyhydroxyalkanoate synthesis repressor PhaR